MKRQLKRIALYAAAIAFLILGVIGLALPFLQGFLFIAIGLVLLSIASQTIRVWMETHTRKYPKVHSFVEKVQQRVEAFVGPTD